MQKSHTFEPRDRSSRKPLSETNSAKNGSANTSKPEPLIKTISGMETTLDLRRLARQGLMQKENSGAYFKQVSCWRLNFDQTGHHRPPISESAESTANSLKHDSRMNTSRQNAYASRFSLSERDHEHELKSVPQSRAGSAAEAGTTPPPPLMGTNSQQRSLEVLYTVNRMSKHQTREVYTPSFFLISGASIREWRREGRKLERLERLRIQDCS